MKFEDTPFEYSGKAGVVGYPGDLDSGHYMYEEWSQISYDMKKTAALLTYHIDTTGGLFSHLLVAL
jgi:hypothetical protein